MAIKAEELRIGNWVYPNDENATPWEIRIIFPEWVGFGENFTTQSDSRPVSIRDIEPIPLSPEILEQVGFERINHIHGYSFYSLSKSKKNRCHIDIYENKTMWMGYSVSQDAHCKYLHQLQNLYYALTGKELTINLQSKSK